MPNGGRDDVAGVGAVLEGISPHKLGSSRGKGCPMAKPELDSFLSNCGLDGAANVRRPKGSKPRDFECFSL